MTNKHPERISSILLGKMQKAIIKPERDLYKVLSESVMFEKTGKGRQGAIIADLSHRMPLVRSTTSYELSTQHFNDVHRGLVNDIRDAFGDPFGDPSIEFNNAMLEIYDYQYTTMGEHSDMSLDLADDSFICLFSCYSDRDHTRKLQVRAKGFDEWTDYVLDNNSVIIWSVQTNQQTLHRIVFDPPFKVDGHWLGITFRMSKTIVRFVDEIPYFDDGAPLRLASDVERKQMMKLKGQQNRESEFVWPIIRFTISKSDLLLFL